MGLKAGILLACLIIMLCSEALFASNHDSVVIYYEVLPVNEIEIKSAPVSLSVLEAKAGSTAVSAESKAFYDITTNCPADSKKLIASLASEIEQGLSIYVRGNAPDGAISTGFNEITTSPLDIVTGIDPVAQSNLELAFRLQAEPEVKAVSGKSVTFTITLIDDM